MNHYFQDNPNLKSNVRLLTVTLLGQPFSFYTDDGIFSKDELDDGTATLIETVSKESVYGRCLDLGCANGMVGIALKKWFPNTQFDLVDVNQRALALAKKNIDYHQLEGIQAFYSDGFSENEHHYQFIFFNPPIRAGKAVIYRLYEQSYHHLLPQGALYVIIRKSHGASSSQTKLLQLFGNCRIVKRNKGYYLLQSLKTQEDKHGN